MATTSVGSNHFWIVALMAGMFLSLCYSRDDKEDIAQRKSLLKVQLHIDQDEKYSRLYAITLKSQHFPGIQLKDCRGKTIELKSDVTTVNSDRKISRTSYSYQIIYVPYETSFKLLTLREIKVEPPVIEAPEEETKITPILGVSDFIHLENVGDSSFNKIVEIVASKHDEKKNYIGLKLLRPNPYSPYIASDNRDYRNFALIHSYLPFEKKYFLKPVSFDVSFSRISFSSTAFNERTWLGVRGFGIDFSFGDRILNLLSYQSPYLSWGVRFLIVPAGSSSNIDSSFFIDLHIKGRSPVNSTRFITNAKLHEATPVFTLYPPRLNVTAGVAFEVKLGRPFNDRLPYLSFYYSGGTREFPAPYVTFVHSGLASAYFSTIQWEAAFSYFWNFDKSEFNRMRLEIGAGSYNVWQVDYDSARTTVFSSGLVSPLTQVRPLIDIDYTHVSQDAKFGAGVRFFDNRLTLTPWIKIFESQPHQIRIEFMAITRTIGRSPQPWETDKGSILQLRYRYGFKE
jgi:hypothetical protein